jgi:hypothetical protein
MVGYRPFSFTMRLLMPLHRPSGTTLDMFHSLLPMKRVIMLFPRCFPVLESLRDQHRMVDILLSRPHRTSIHTAHLVYRDCLETTMFWHALFLCQ